MTLNDIIACIDETRKRQHDKRFKSSPRSWHRGYGTALIILRKEIERAQKALEDREAREHYRGLPAVPDSERP